MDVVITILVIAVLELVYVDHLKPWLEKRKADKQAREKVTSDDGVTALSIIQDFLKDNGCQADYYDVDDEDMQGISFVHTGGQYLAHVSKTNKNFMLVYPHFLSVSANSQAYINAFCDSRTSALKFFKVSSSFDESDNTMSITLTYETMTISRSDIERVVGVASALAEELRQQWAEYVQKVDDIDTINLSRREMYMLAESELLKKPDDAVTTQFDIMTIGSLIAYIFDYEKQDSYQRLTVIADDNEQPQVVTQAIPNIFLSDLLQKKSEEEAIFSNVQLSVLTDNNAYLIALRFEGESEATTYYRVSALKEPRSMNKASTKQTIPCEHKSVLVGFDKTDDEKHRQEFRYMYLDAQDKLKEGRDDELTEAQKMLVGMEYSSDSQAIYEARKMYAANRFYEVVALLVPVYNRFKPKFFSLTKHQTESFFELCYLIGMSYLKMNTYDRAFYYLELTNSCGQYRYSMGYINLLIDDNDVRIFREVNGLHDVLQRAVRENDSKEPTEEQVSFYEYLERRRGIAYLNFGDLNEAENIFKDLLESEDSKPYAEEQLKRIEELKKNKDNSDHGDQPTT